MYIFPPPHPLILPHAFFSKACKCGILTVPSREGEWHLQHTVQSFWAAVEVNVNIASKCIYTYYILDYEMFRRLNILEKEGHFNWI